jgi:pyridoxine/pyridoxamine 5'-phosphate oxidase
MTRVDELVSRPEPAFFNDLNETLAEAWRLLARGVADRRSPMHHPTVATLGLDGRPRVRTVVLRGVEPTERRLRFHTDLRSDKVAELRAEGRVALHAYDAKSKIQLRIDGIATVHTDDAVADAAWAGSRPMSRVCYGTSPPPGRPLSEPNAFTLPDEAETDHGRANFTAVVVCVSSIEWLYLAYGGHRRALFTWAPGGAFAQTWLVP